MLDSGCSIVHVMPLCTVVACVTVVHKMPQCYPLFIRNSLVHIIYLGRAARALP